MYAKLAAERGSFCASTTTFPTWKSVYLGGVRCARRSCKRSTDAVLLEPEGLQQTATPVVVLMFVIFFCCNVNAAKNVSGHSRVARRGSRQGVCWSRSLGATQTLRSGYFVLRNLASWGSERLICEPPKTRMLIETSTARDRRLTLRLRAVTAGKRVARRCASGCRSGCRHRRRYENLGGGL